MDKRIIETDIPISPNLVNEYTLANGSGTNDILFSFDLSKTQLSPRHVMGYLSNLKIDAHITNIDHDFMYEYMTTPFLLGNTNLAQCHANILNFYLYGEYLYGCRFPNIVSFIKKYEFMIQDQIKVIESLPLFLLNSIEDYDVQLPNVDKRKYDTVGVNIARLVQLSDVILRICGDDMYKIDEQTYYKNYFDEYIYGGTKLIQFFIDNPDNLLHAAIETMVLNNVGINNEV